LTDERQKPIIIEAPGASPREAGLLRQSKAGPPSQNHGGSDQASPGDRRKNSPAIRLQPLICLLKATILPPKNSKQAVEGVVPAAIVGDKIPHILSHLVCVGRVWSRTHALTHPDGWGINERSISWNTS